MSELINNSEQRKTTLKRLIRELHGGMDPAAARTRLEEFLEGIPYGEVVEVEQDLIREGISQEEIQKFCDIHSSMLDGHIDQSMAKLVPPGHPVDTFKKENEALAQVTARIMQLVADVDARPPAQIPELVLQLRTLFNELGDLDKHYRRKENLLFPYLEQHGITGPPTVMWGKHDEIRRALQAAREALAAMPEATPADLSTTASRLLIPAARAVDDMIMKEEQILFPLSMDTLTDLEWYEIHQQTPEIGFCLYDPRIEWKPRNIDITDVTDTTGDGVRMPSGTLNAAELTAILNTVPFDLTFVDAEDKVKYFSQGAERIFDRNRAILGRDVRLCHPPASMHIVDRIIEDFRSGRQESAPFWIQMQGKFIHIEYFAVRDPQGNYLGTLEVSQDLTAKRALDGEQRLLSYADKDTESSAPVAGQQTSAATHIPHGAAAPGSAPTAEHARIVAGDPPPPGHEPPAEHEPRPDWAIEDAVHVRVDAVALLGQGANPLGEVVRALGGMATDELLYMPAPFYPAPMVQVLRSQGHDVWGEEIAAGWALWVRKH
ncbi:MAG: DUF438 domain-containing protein [Bacteroidota bacterium]|nr:DUF438 domain-containing protein [Bacteroidota bacterium]